MGQSLCRRWCNASSHPTAHECAEGNAAFHPQALRSTVRNSSRIEKRFYLTNTRGMSHRNYRRNQLRQLLAGVDNKLREAEVTLMELLSIDELSKTVENAAHLKLRQTLLGLLDAYEHSEATA